MIENQRMKNAQVLPHFGDASDANLNISKKEQIKLVVAKNQSRMGRAVSTANQGMFKVAE